MMCSVLISTTHKPSNNRAEQSREVSKMVTKLTFKDNSPHFLIKKLLPFALYAIIPLLLFRLYIHPIHSFKEQVPRIKEQVSEQKKIVEIASCDYTNGNWVHDKLGPLYNGTNCNTIKEGQNCISHGRPDVGFLYWRWKPKQCNLPRFQPLQFLNILSNKHLAFVGDSMARNQLESLLCLISSVSSPVLVYTDGDDNKFRKWHFPSHNLNVSVFWSPFLVKGVEKNVNLNHNKLFLDSIDGRWGGELDDMDMVVLSLGHWYLHPAVYYEGNTILGCHYCPGLNHTEIGFYDVFRKAWRTTLDTLLRRRGNGIVGKPIDVIVTTFSPSHFEGEWDKAGACPKKEPFKQGEREVEGMDEEMRRIGVEEVEMVKRKINNGGFSKLRIEALDITRLSVMRGDGHPGPYMYAFPFANGVGDRVQNDCVHWCLPGPIDTWNEIMLEVMKRWEAQTQPRSEVS